MVGAGTAACPANYLALKRKEVVMRRRLCVVICAGLLTLAACNRVGPDSVQAAPEPVGASPAIDVPAGTRIRVRLLQTLDTQRNRARDQFTASLDEPLVVGDRVVVPKGTNFDGHITQSKPSGRFKGRAALALNLDSFELNGQKYEIRSTNVARTSAGRKKHHLLWIGGGSASGAAIGAIAGGGSGALIGAGAGAVAGTVGSAITGKRNIRLPAETTLTFTLQSPISLRT
jgi:hypothetical protein